MAFSQKPRASYTLMLRLCLWHRPDKKLLLALHWEITFHVSALIYTCVLLRGLRSSMRNFSLFMKWKVKIGAVKLLSEMLRTWCTLHTGLIIWTKTHFCPRIRVLAVIFQSNLWGERDKMSKWTVNLSILSQNMQNKLKVPDISIKVHIGNVNAWRLLFKLSGVIQFSAVFVISGEVSVMKTNII